MPKSAAATPATPATPADSRPWPEYLDVKAACRFTSLSRRTLDSAKAMGDLPFYRCGTKILFSRADLVAWLGARRVDVRADAARIERRG